MSNLFTKFSGFAKLDLLYGGKTINPIYTMHAHINLFFTHLEYSENELPFQEVEDILLTAKSPVKALEEFHRKFAAVMYRIVSLRFVSSNIHDTDYITSFGVITIDKAKGVDELFKELIRHNKMLTKIVDYLGLEDLGLFKLGDTMMDSKLVNLALYMLAASDFDFEIMSSMTCEILQFDCLTPTPGCIVEFDSYRWFKNKGAAKVHESSFHSKVLNMKRDEIFELVQIKANFEYHERRDYYQQFVGPIYEEIRKGIDQAMIALANGREKKMNFRLKLQKWKIEDDNDIQVFQCLIIDDMDSKLLDHSPNEEVVLLTFNGPQKNGAKPSVKTQIRGILTDFDMNEKTKKYVSCKLLISSVDYFQYSNDKEMFRVYNPIYANFLISVMSFGRMLGACVNPPRNCGIVESIVTGNLPVWGADVDGSRSFAVDAVAMAMVSNCELNSKQAEAICDFAAAPRGLYLLQGPPGTGKTTTIIRLLKHMLEINPVQRIMLCAPSNAAVHILAERAMEVLGRDVSMVLRGVDKNMSKTLRRIYCNNITKRLSSEIKHYLDRLELLQKSSSNYNNAAFLTLVDDLSDVFTDHQFFFVSIQARFIATDSNNNNTILRFNHHIDMRDAILKLLAAVDSQFIVMKQAILDFRNNVVSKQEQVACIVSSLNDYCQIVKSSSTAYESHLEVFMLLQSQLIFTTLVSSGSKIMRKNIHDIDVLIIDEAGQAVEPELLIPINFNPKKCLQVGDNKQLPATVLSDENKVILYDQSMMSRLIERARAIPKMLEIQYRMHPAICSWPSSMYYNDLLRADDSLLQRCSIVQHTTVCDYLRSPCVFIDVDGVEVGKQNHDTSYKNLAEAECAVSILKHLLKEDVPPESIGIIAFYSSQVALLDKNTSFLPVDGRGMKSVKISTVDSFQGMERDIIILCTTRTCKSAGFLRDYRRINVAVTRAKHNLYVLGKRSVLEESNTDLSRMIQHYKKYDECNHLNSTVLLALISEIN